MRYSVAQHVQELKITAAAARESDMLARLLHNGGHVSEDRTADEGEEMSCINHAQEDPRRTTGLAKNGSIIKS